LENLEDKQVEGALKKRDAIGFFLTGRHTTGVCAPSGRMSTGRFIITRSVGSTLVAPLHGLLPTVGPGSRECHLDV
jgi:hypothetical protein